MDRNAHLHQLITILQNACSGEQAAAYAYRGHWKSLDDSRSAERRRIQVIEEEEWVHRHEAEEMLRSLGASPAPVKEVRTWFVGRALGLACHVTGWFLPMYFAGRLESGNAGEYDDAAYHAAALGYADYERRLGEMAGVERQHELFFRSVIAGHPWVPRMKRLFGWE